MKRAVFLFLALTVSSAHAAVSGPQRLAIYYGYPSLVNGAAGNLTTAAAELGKFDVVVLGDGIEHAGHGDHANTATIINTLIGSGTQVYGYVDMGVSTQNLSIATAEQYIDEWDAMNVTGIFWDDAGYDYGVTRARQKALIDYTHAKGLKAFVNAWVPADVFAIDAGVPTPLVAGDWYLAESHPVADGTFADLSFWWNKSQTLASYRLATNVNIAAIATGNDGATGWPNSAAYRQSLWAAYLFAWDAFGFTNIQYSSSGAGANRARPLPHVVTDVGDSYTGAPTMQSATRFTRTTDNGTIEVTGDAMSGYGTFRGGACDTTMLGAAIWPNCAGSPPPQSSPFGPRQKASEGHRYDFHRGVDIPQPLGSPVYAMQDGLVRIGGSDPGYSDLLIQIRHRADNPYLYSNVLHMDSVIVDPNDLVTVGDLVGYSGESVSEFDHMHMEFRDSCLTQNCNRNPWNYLPYSDQPPVSPTLAGANLTGSQSALLIDASTLPSQLDFDGVSLSWGGNFTAAIDAINATTIPAEPLLLDHPIIDLGDGASVCIFPQQYNTGSSSADYRFAFSGLPDGVNGSATGLDVSASSSAVALSPNLPTLQLSPAAPQVVGAAGQTVVFHYSLTNTGGGPLHVALSAASAQNNPLVLTPDNLLLASNETLPVSVEVTLDPDFPAGVGDCILLEADAGGAHTVIALGKAVTSYDPSASGCTATPASDCADAGTESVALQSDPESPSRKKLQWKFGKSIAAIDAADFGNPVDGAAGYRLCIYDTLGNTPTLSIGMSVAAGGTCSGKPCWKSVRGGYKFKDRAGAQDGITGLALKAGAIGKGKLALKAKGLNLGLPPAAGAQYFNADTTVRIQLVETNAGACWESTFTAPTDVKKHTPTQFKAKHKL